MLRALMIGAIAILHGALMEAPAQSPSANDGYNAFRMVRTRNIFDPERRAVRTEAPRPAAPQTPARDNYISLTGTMVTTDKSLAFFAGSKSEFNKVLGRGEAIADYKIKSVLTTGVELERDGKPLVLGVGRQLTLEGAGAGTVGVATASEPVPAPTPTVDSSISAPPAAASSAPAPAAPGAQSDILKRMMERRQKEMSK